MRLVLRAVDVAGPWQWRWLLSDESSGHVLADHQVVLDPGAAEVVAFADLYGYAQWHSAPDRKVADETLIVARAGDWAGRMLLGEKISASLAQAAPVTVRVAAPDGPEQVLGWPLELALASRGDIAFVYDVAAPAVTKAPVSDALRVLALFSQPTETSVVALRRARYELVRLIRRVAARPSAAVELRVVQYGATRQRLAEIADEGAGWDVLQLWGHGGPGQFLLEHADGSPDRVDVADLVRLLRPLRSRLKLAVVAACESAAGVTAQALRLIGLDRQAEQLEDEEQERPETIGVTQALVAELGCAVVGMRYPVTDEFAIAFCGAFYERLLERGQPVDVAVARALAETAGPSLSMATPGVFGGVAAGLRLELPRGKPVLDPAEARMAYFPSEPERFVGRAAAMAAASAALAPGSDRTTVLLHGMAGAGKTACALELAYRHQDSFGAVAFWQAPTRDDEWPGALASLANALEIQLGGYGFSMASHIGTASALEAFLPRLRQVMADNAVLLVLDNLETLLTAEGTWRDPFWPPLIAALSGHDGESRLILTSRIPPVGLASEMLTLPVHALSLDESVTLARELPNLRALLYSHAGDRDRDRVRRILRVVQGHPKLLELADAAAADRDRLNAQLSAAERAAAGQALEAFFRDGTSSLDPDDFLAALSTWTTTALTALPDAVRLMAQFLACIEDDDRWSFVINGIWPVLWRRVSRSGDPPDPAHLLEALASAALVQPDPLPAAKQNRIAYRMHPGVAAAIGAAAPPSFRDSVDAELAMFWRAVAYQAQQQEDGELGALVVRAGLAAAPYLLRRGDWAAASALLEQVIYRDMSPRTVQAALPALQRIAATTGAPKDHVILGRALSTVDPAEGERLVREALNAAVSDGDWLLASSAAGYLAGLLVNNGRLDKALDMLTQQAGYTGRAGLGPWTQLADQAARLQILAVIGKHQQVLAESDELRAQMGELPLRRDHNETVEPWNVREGILYAGYSSALALERWQRCLDLNAEIVASKRQRGAGLHEVTLFQFGDAGPQIRLGRLAEAGQLLRECQQVFEDHRDITRLAMVLSTRANLEYLLGHLDAAARLGQTAIRLRYARPDATPRDMAVSHNNLALYLSAAGADPIGQRAHLMAAALIYRLASMDHYYADTLQALASDLRADGGAVTPATLAEVIEVTEQTEGVRLGNLIAALEPEPGAAEAALAQILRDAADPPPAAVTR
ncbi:MAG TPA: CHAT domain-containing protein [Streptosporangiaceae bacterium]